MSFSFCFVFKNKNCFYFLQFNLLRNQAFLSPAKEHNLAIKLSCFVNFISSYFYIEIFSFLAGFSCILFYFKTVTYNVVFPTHLVNIFQCVLMAPGANCKHCIVCVRPSCTYVLR